MSPDTACNLVFSICVDEGYNQLYLNKMTSDFANIFMKYQQFTSKKQCSDIAFLTKKTSKKHCKIIKKHCILLKCNVYAII